MYYRQFPPLFPAAFYKKRSTEFPFSVILYLNQTGSRSGGGVSPPVRQTERLLFLEDFDVRAGNGNRKVNGTMDHTQLSILDLAIIALYLLTMVAVGIYFVRRIKNTGDYYVAGRSLGPLVMMATVCATIIGGSGLMGRAGVAYSSGFKAVITAVPYLLGMFIFSGIAGKISDIGMKYDVTSIPDLFSRRFGRTAKIMLAAMVAFTMMGTVASQVTATATIINMLGGQVGLSFEAGALIACVIFMVYTASSGLFGVVYTDVLQFYMLILFVYILIPAASLGHIGGFSTFLANLDPALAKPYINGSILGDIVTYLVFTMAGAEMWQRAFAAKNRGSAKKGMFLGTSVYGITIALVYFMGVAAHQIIGDEALAVYGSTDAVVPALAIHVLPIGLTGLALAGILSVIMSTADSYLLVSVQTCVHDIGKTFSRRCGTKPRFFSPAFSPLSCPWALWSLHFISKTLTTFLCSPGASTRRRQASRPLPPSSGEKLPAPASLPAWLPVSLFVLAGN